MSLQEKQDVAATHTEAIYDESLAAIEAEERLSFRQGARHFKRAYCWAIFFSTALVCGGFDFQITGSILAVSAFRQQFGEPFQNDYVIPAAWLSAFNTVSYFGGFFGALVCGWFADRFGRKLALGLGISLLTLGAVLQIVALSRPVFLVSKIIFGIGSGYVIAVTPMLAGEVTPVCLRGAVTAGLNLSILSGQLLSNAVLRGFGADSEKFGLWAYRAPLAFQFLFPCLILPGLFFAPESPWHLARRGKLDQASKALTKLYGDSHVQARLQTMLRTIQEEDAKASATYKSCFTGVNRRRTMISVGVFACQHLSGVAFVLSYSTYFFELAGLRPENALDMGVGVTACGFIGNILSIYLLSVFGRRRPFIIGYVAIVVFLFMIGFLDLSQSSAAKWVQATFTVIYGFIYNASIGALSYVILVENSSPLLRSKTASLASATQNCFFVIMHFAIPYMVNPDEGNLKGKVGFVFGGFSAILWIWAFFFIPDLKNKSFAEIDYLYEYKVPARKMGKFAVPPANSRHTGEVEISP